MSLTPASLDPRTRYCVLRNAALRESVIVQGREVQAGGRCLDGFQRFSTDDVMPDHHVRLRCGDFDVAVWRDPSRPELNTADAIYSFERIDPLMAPEARSQMTLEEVAFETQEALAWSRMSEKERIAACFVAENELAQEIAHDAGLDPLRDLSEHLRKVVGHFKSLYVYS
jgi:hypothetical protein